MKEEFSAFSTELDLVRTDRILFYLNSCGNLVSNLGNADFVLFLDKDLYLSTGLERLGYKVFNSARAISLCDDKMLTHLALSNAGIRMPKTISAPLNYTGESTKAFLDNLERELGFPMVAKSNFGSLGREVHLIKNRQELDSFEQRLLYYPRLYQEFVSTSFGFDYRVIVTGGKVVAAMKRKNESGDFRSNIAQGGRGTKIILSEEQEKAALKAASILGLDYCGIDLLEGANGDVVLCEVNSNAFLTGIESVTGINVAGAYARHIMEKLALV